MITLIQSVGAGIGLFLIAVGFKRLWEIQKKERFKSIKSKEVKQWE